MGMDRGGVTGRWVVKLGVATAVIHRADPPTRDKPEAARRTRTIDDNSRAAGRCYSKRRECAQRSVAAVVAAAASEVFHESLIKPANASQKSSSPWPLATTASRRTHAQTAGAWANASYRTDWTNQQGFPHHSVSVRNVKKGPTVPPRGAPGMCEKMAVIVVAPPQAKSQRWPIAAAAGGRLWERPAWQCWHHTQEITGGCVPLHLLVSSAFPAPKLCKPEPVSPPCSLFG
ncbi:hypothetical protein S40285_10224 [Stachybotrys chlorohalonatus IBT 40285]|uniref:Uncharacterized protein n=1 Tax=Stachybotrys chlorohalonatus (strain IBT 40285) TaxID=1283841 RepID=A0A084QC37_STAC4|nr:hypothetical protein S40285_10224 [Stachybotrys chlorohalonata IBT 40285]